MTGRILILVVCFFAISVHAQDTGLNTAGAATPTPQAADELLTHLAAAERHQLSGNLIGAAIENRAVLGIALQRSGRIAIEEGKYDDAIRVLTASLRYADTAPNRTNLAIAYLRREMFEEALREAKTAVSIDSNHIGARYILGNIYYSREEYENALPELERVFVEAPDFEIARALGLTYLNLKMPEKARKHFEQMRISAGKDNADLHILFAKFYERTNYPGDAERELIRALKIEPGKLRANFYLGYLLLQNGGSERMADAGAAFEQELKLNPNDFYSLFFSGVVASSENNHQRAIPFLQRAVEINPQSGEAHLFLAQSQIEVDDLENAEKNLRRSVELESNGKKNTQARRTHFMLGRLLLRTGRKEEGRKELVIAGKLQQASLNSSRDEITRILGQVAESSELEPEEETTESKFEIELPPERVAELKKVKEYLADVTAQAFNSLGVIATQDNRLREAVDNFKSSSEWKPSFPNVHRNLGIVSFRAGYYEQAITPLQQHLDSAPTDSLIRKLLGTSHYFMSDFSKSVETLKPIEANLTDDAELAYFYGISLIRLERNLEAIPVFNKLAEASQQKPGELFYAAQGFMTLGDYKRAIKEFGQVLAIAPDTPKANYFVGQSLIRLNRLAEAEAAFSRELVINPIDPLSKYHLALTLIERRVETEKAIRVLEDAIRLRFGYADALYQLGKIYLEKGEYEKAIEKLESAVNADSDKDYIHYQLSIAYRKVSRTEDADRELRIYQELKNGKRKLDKPMPMGGNRQ